MHKSALICAAVVFAAFSSNCLAIDCGELLGSEPYREAGYRIEQAFKAELQWATLLPESRNSSRIIFLVLLGLNSGRTEKDQFMDSISVKTGNGFESARKAIDFLNHEGLLLKVRTRGVSYLEITELGSAKLKEMLDVYLSPG